MGALSRYRSYLLNQFRMKVRSYGFWANQQPVDMLAIHPGLTVGPTVANEPPSNGETAGEFYLSNDLNPNLLFVWDGAFWHKITTTKIVP